MNSAFLLRLVVIVATFACGPLATAAESLAAVKARMEQRLDSLGGLKDRGVAGENNRGFLEIRGNASGSDQQVISDENADRRTVYAALAAQTGTSADAVGRQRAQQLSSLARRGHWVQDPNGAWRQKG